MVTSIFMSGTTVLCFYKSLKTLRSGLGVGIIVLSQLSDLYGRRSIAITSICAAALFEMAIAFVYEYWVLLVLRFLSGICAAGSTGIGGIYLNELLTWRQRPIAVFLANLMWSVLIKA